MSFVGTAIGFGVAGTTGAMVGAVAGSTLMGAYGAKKQASAYEKGAEAQADAANRAADLQMEQYYQSRQDQLPWLAGGEQGLYDYMSLMGIDMPYAQGQGRYYDELQNINNEIGQLQQSIPGISLPNQALSTQNFQDAKGLYGKVGAAALESQKNQMSQQEHDQSTKRLNELLKRKQFLESQITPVKADQAKLLSRLQASPDYQFALSEGMKAQNYALNKRGLLGSGRADKERQRYAQGLASQQLGSYRNALAALSGVGQSSASNIGQFGASAASNAGQAQMNAGAARASGYQAQGQGYANMSNALSGGVGDLMGYAYLSGKGPFKPQ